MSISQSTPTSVNARHTYVGNELDWAKSEETRVDDNAFADSIEPVLDAGLSWELTADTNLGAGLQLVSTPGHTPGHCSLQVNTATEPANPIGRIENHRKFWRFVPEDPSQM